MTRDVGPQMTPVEVAVHRILGSSYASPGLPLVLYKAMIYAKSKRRVYTLQEKEREKKRASVRQYCSYQRTPETGESKPGLDAHMQLLHDFPGGQLHMTDSDHEGLWCDLSFTTGGVHGVCGPPKRG